MEEQKKMMLARAMPDVLDSVISSWKFKAMPSHWHQPLLNDVARFSHCHLRNHINIQEDACMFSCLTNFVDK
jgi:hypothetical protein